MIILTRRVDDKLLIGDDVVVTIFAANEGLALMSVEAPSSVKVHPEDSPHRFFNKRGLIDRIILFLVGALLRNCYGKKKKRVPLVL